MTGEAAAIGDRHDPRDRAAYGAMIDRLRGFLDTLAGAAPAPDTADALATDLAAWEARLAPLAVAEDRRMFGRIDGDASHGQTMCPAIELTGRHEDRVAGTVLFDRYFLGGNGAAHGGAVALMFDKLLGQLANPPRAMVARTAYLHVDYRAITPIGVELAVEARMVSIDGRKRLARGALRHGDRICAEAEGLFVELREGQP